MAKSKVRGGAKAHRKRVQKRNEQLALNYKKAAKEAWDKFELWKKEQDGNQNNQSISITT